MISEITNPMKPITNIPIADTFATSLSSSPEGFFNTCQTLLLCETNNFILLGKLVLTSSIFFYILRVFKIILSAFFYKRNQLSYPMYFLHNFLDYITQLQTESCLCLFLHYGAFRSNYSLTVLQQVQFQ